MTRRIAAIALAGAVGLSLPAYAQAPSWLWWGSSQATSVPTSVANPLPVTPIGGGSGMLASGSNATSLALQNISQNSNTGLQFGIPGAAHDGVTDDTTAINTALAACGTAGGGTVVGGPFHYLTNSADIVIPAGCSFKLSSTPTTALGSKVSFTQPALLLAGNHTIQNSGTIDSMAIFNPAPMAISTSTIRGSLNYVAAFSGTAITIAGPQSRVLNTLIIGYSQCYTVTAKDRPNMQHVMGDCLNPMTVNNVQDIGVMEDINWHTFMPVGAQAIVTQSISGAADNGSGAIRVTVPSTANYLTNDTVYFYKIGGFVGANGRWPVTVVGDGVSLDLQGSASAPTTTGTWTSLSKRIAVASTTSLWPGQTVSGTGIAANSTITHIDWQASVIYVSVATTAGGSGTTLTFGNSAYTSGGNATLTADTRTGTAYQIIDTNSVFLSNVFEYGWTTGYSLSGASLGNNFSNASCDSEHIFDPNSVCFVNSATGENTWVAGTNASAVATLYDTSSRTTRVSSVGFSGAFVGSVPISTITTRLIISNSTLLAQAGIALNPGDVAMDVAPNGRVELSGDNFGALAAFVEPGNTGSDPSQKLLVDWSTRLANWLYSPSNDNFLVNPEFVLDQPNESATYTSNSAMMDGWHSQSGSVGGTLVYSRETTNLMPGVAAQILANATVGGAPSSGSFASLQQRIEGSRVTSLGFGTQSAQPVAVSFLENCSVGGTYVVNLSNGATATRLYSHQYTLLAGVPTQVTVNIPADTGGSWTLSGAGDGLMLSFPLTAGSTFQTATFDAWQTVAGSAGSLGSASQVQLTSTTSNTCRLSDVKLETGVHPTVFVSRNLASELNLAQRYYRKTFTVGYPASGVQTGQNKGLVGARCVQNPIAVGQPSLYWQFDPPMVAAPTITTYNPSATNANWRDVTAGADVAVSVDPSTAKGMTGIELATGATVTTLADSLCIHASADSRL